MRVCIRRGAAEVGGSCVEVEADGRRLVLDAGLPLEPAEVPMRDLLPDVPGLWARGDGSLLALLISHGHPDHCGLADLVAPGVRVLAGAATVRIAEEAAFFGGASRALAAEGRFRSGQAFEIGPFSITPLVVDHSAFDAYALVIEAGGRRLVYSGDLRAHGRKPGTMSRFAHAARGADALLLEGTRMGADGRAPWSERDVELRIAEVCRENEGIVLTAAAAQNVDRLVSLFRAARQAGRELVLDLYAASVLAATRHPSVPTAHWDGVRVFLPASQRHRVIEARAFDRPASVRHSRIYPDELRASPERFLMLFRSSMARDLERADCLDGAVLVWSLWTGYLDRDERLRAFRGAHQLPMHIAHASGHAHPNDLRALVVASRAEVVVPIHTDDPEACRALGPNVTPRPDGEWWEV